MENTKTKKMTWRAGRGKYFYSEKGHYSATLVDGTHIEVHPDVYSKVFNEYLTLRGIRPTTWSEIMGKAEREWQAYYRLLDAFAEDIQQWFDYRDPGIFIDLPRGQKLLTVRAEPDTGALLLKEPKKLSVWRRKMAWYAGCGQHGSSHGGYHAVNLEDGTRIEVRSETYDQRFNAYLNDLGAQRMSLFGIMRKADAEWQAYYQLMNNFAEDIHQWLTFRGEGIFVSHPRS